MPITYVGIDPIKVMSKNHKRSPVSSWQLEVTTLIPVPFTLSKRCILLGNKAYKSANFNEKPLVPRELLR